MSAVNDGSYSEVCLVGITKKGGSETQFASLIELDSISPQSGDKGISTKKMANGGRVVSKSGMDDTEITLKLYEIEIGTANSLVQLFNGTTDATAPLSSTNTAVMNLFRVAFLWTDDTAAATAGGTTASGNYALREVYTDLRMTACKTAIEDGTRVVNVTFMGPAYKQDATGLVTHESVTSSDGSGLSALSSYS